MTTNEAGAWLRQAMERLTPLSDAPALEARALLEHVLERSRADLAAHPETQIRADQLQRLNDLLARLTAGEPLPYLTGRQEFYGLNFAVSPAVLIPRPETELLVENALTWLRHHPTHRRAAEAGIGSGCISVTLAVHTPDLQIAATDRSRAALDMAAANAARHNVRERIALLQADLLTPLRGPFDIVCANLPYIPGATLAGLRVRHYEPRLALDGGADGLDCIRALLSDAHRWLAPGGLLLLEIEASQGQTACQAARRALPAARIDLLHDLAGLPRLVKVENPA